MTAFMMVRTLFDLILFIAVAVYAHHVMADHDHDLGKNVEDLKSKVPTMFEIYSLKPFQGVKHVEHFYKQEIIDKVMCDGANDPVGCTGTNLSAFMTNLQLYTNCTARTGLRRSPMCTHCVDEYGPRVHADIVALGDPWKVATEAEAETHDVRRWRDDLEGCMTRTESAYTVELIYDTNPWLQLYIWTSFALLYTSLQFTWIFDNSSVYAKYAFPFLAFVAVAATGITLIAQFDNGSYDTHFSLLQFTLIFVTFGFMLWQGGKTEKVRTTAMGIFMLAAAPSIMIIIASFHAWLEYDMVNILCTLATTLFGLCLCDDLLSVYWSNERDSKTQEAHVHLHVFIFATCLFIVIIMATLNLPAPPPQDLYFGALFFVLFIIFAGVYTLTPTLLYETTTLDTLDILLFKQLAEIFIRGTFVVITWSIYSDSL